MDHHGHHGKGHHNWYINCTTTKYDNTTHAADLHCELVEAKKKKEEKRVEKHNDFLNDQPKEGRRLMFMKKLKHFRRSCPFAITVIIDHKCFALFKRHSRQWWRKWWQRHGREWRRRHCPFLFFLFSLWNFCAWTLVISVLCCCCCRRKRKFMMNKLIDDYSHVQN